MASSAFWRPYYYHLGWYVTTANPLGAYPRSARRLAGQTNRLVLIHFWASWCDHCKWMEAEVFTQPSVAAALAPTTCR